MLSEELIQRLQDADPAVRVEALRILAMVEETEAVDAVLVVYKQDPVPDVRKVAQWAGRILWQAQKRGHSTAKALEARYAAGLDAEREALLLDAMTKDGVRGKNARETANLVAQERLRREMYETMQEDRKSVPPAADATSLTDLAASLLGDDDDER